MRRPLAPQERQLVRRPGLSAFARTAYLVDQPLEVVLDMTVAGSDIHLDLSRSSPPCRGPMNSVWATTQSAVYVAIKHIFPDVPINAGCFAPIHIARPEGTFLYARYPRPVAGCAAEVAQRIMEAVFGAMGKANELSWHWACPAPY